MSFNFIKNIVDGKQDELSHKQFRRFGKGVFEKKAMVSVKKTKEGYKIKTTFEYLDEILLYLAENYKGDVEVSGTIQGVSDLQAKAGKFGLIGEKKNVMGVKKLVLNPTSINAAKLKEMLAEFKDEFLLLSVKGKGFEMISKEGLPKPGKTVKEGEDGKIDFCKIECSDDYNGLVKEFLFDVKEDFKECIVRHVFIINGFDVPAEYINDPAKARIYALRKGVIKRVVEIDGVKSEKEYPFSA